MITLGLLAIAILPGFIIIQRYYSKDHLQKEPIGVILRSFFWGAALVIPAGLAENFLPDEGTSTLELAIHYFLVVAFTEELCKYTAIRLYSANHNAFNEHFDGIVYGAAVGGGFATFENIFYVLDHGFAVGILRAFLSVPGHILWGAIIGHWIAKAKMEKKNGFLCFVAGVGISTFLHGGFDFILNFGDTALFGAPFFILFPLWLVRRYTKSALEKDNQTLGGYPTEEKQMVRIGKPIELPKLIVSLFRTLLYTLSVLFAIFSIVLFGFCFYDFYYGDDTNFETWMFSIPSLSAGISIGLFAWGKRFRST
ncbi:PrsW family intramembrane metalloprotease [Leptospira sp. 'Mane']|uniref:PrsW family intramembrane metalloprotease n=1 Tax=Leptospira sp. 'Mane' TaxID=3387407 RepID=UPI00398AB14E